MTLGEYFLEELKVEAPRTRKLLERVPMDRADYKPHEKNTPMGLLATHIADLVGWIPFTINSDGLDFATMDYTPHIAKDSEELLSIFDKNVAEAEEILAKTSDEKMNENWTMRTGETTLHFTLPKGAVVRSFSMNHVIHHRAQLGVYLRLLNIPLPGIYGPTADEQM